MLLSLNDAFLECSLQQLIEVFEIRLWSEKKPLYELDFAIDTLIRFKALYEDKLEELENGYRAN